MTNKKKDDASGGDEMGGVDALKRGDYMIHVFLEKVKEIKTEAGSTVDPIFEVTCLNQKQYSSAKSKIGGISEVVYSEHLFLEAQNVEKNDAKEAKIVIKLSDKGIFKNTLIGLFEFDLSQIYLKPQHALLHKWLALSNPTSEKYSEITGYVKLSINVTQTGDESIQINDDDGPEDTDILMPPSLNPKFYQLKFRLFKCMDLPAMDQAIGGGVIASAKTDAYVRTEYKGKKYKTKVITMIENGPPIDWNEEIWIPAQIPIIYPRVILNVMDYDASGDEVVGSLLFDLQDIVDGKYKGKFFWKNIYGSAMNQSNSEHKRNMNENPELASNWKGRVLINIDCEETEKPVAKVVKIDGDNVMASKQFCIPQKYHINVEFGQGVALPASKKYQLKLIVGGHTIMSGEAKNKIKTSYNNFNSRQYKLAELPYQTFDDMGKIILLLMDGSTPVCYYKDDIYNYNEPNAQYKWVQLQPDLCVGKVKDPNLAGIISFKLSVIKHDDNTPIDFKKFAAWKRPPLERLEPAKIRVYIYQARDLPAADASGDSDPFITVWDTSEKVRKTDIVEDNTNPSYYQTLEIDYEVRDFNDITTYPPFILDVFDSDTGLMDSSDDFLGRAMIFAKDCKISHQKDFARDPQLEIPEKPTWQPIRFAVGEPTCGEILCSFSVSASDYKYVYADADAVDLKSTVQFMEFDVNMLILGLRQLQSPGIMPVQKAFIIFNVKSLVPNDIASISNIQTTPKAPGPNPTINTTINFSIPMPADPLFAPKLSCAVYDQIFKGFSQPQIGVFVIPMGQLVQDLKQEREEETAEIEKINYELKKIMKQAGLEVKDFNAPKNIKSINDSRAFSGEEQNAIGKKVVRLQDPSVLDDSDIDVLLDKERRGSESQHATKKRKAPQQRQISKHQKSHGNQTTDNNITETFEVYADEAEDNAARNMSLQMQKLKQQKEMIKLGKIPSKVNFLKGKIQQEQTNSDLLGLSKPELEAILKEQKAKEKRFQEQERERAQENLLAQGVINNSVIVMPKYEIDARLKVDREYGIPSGELFIGLGWDENKETKRKHYRQFYPDELENVKEIFPKPSPFNTFNLKKGQSRGLSGGGFMSLFKKTKKDESGQVSDEKVVGIFKAIIEVKSKKDEQEYIVERQNLLQELKNNLQAIARQKIGQEIEIDYEKLGSAMERRSLDAQLRQLDVSHLNITKHVADLESDEILKRQLMCKVRCIVRFYAISAFNLSSRDNGSASDPYLILKCNNKVYNERSIYQLDEPNPKFLKHYDFEGHFPGCSPLEIGVWDYDDIFGDDLIGSTIVDLEDRYFSIEWQSLEDKPIEYRQIYHETSSQEQGVVKCWVEINPTNDPNPVTLWDIREKPPEPIEVRVAIFNADGIPMMDWEGTCDCFFRNFFDSKEDVQETDTHFRNQDGKPDFQYRLIYKIQVPRKDYKLHIQAYDRDFFKSNDMIGEATIDLQQILEDCCLVKKPLGLNEEYYKNVMKSRTDQKIEFDSKDKSRFWIQMKNKDEHGKEIKTGRVKVQIDVLPQQQADKNPVGKARDTPNHSPSLPQPEGRIELSLNPIKMFNQLVGPEVRRQICKWFFCFICAFLCAYCIPGLLSSLGANFITNKIFG